MRPVILALFLSGCVTLKNSPTTVGNNNRVEVYDYGSSSSSSAPMSDTSKKALFLTASLVAVGAGCFGADYLWDKGYKAPAELTGAMICLPGILATPFAIGSFAF